MNVLILGIIGTPEIVVILIAALVLFGGKKIPELMRGLGKGLKEFKDASKGIIQDDESDSDLKNKEK